MSERRTAPPSSKTNGPNRLARLVERIQLKRAVLGLVALALAADVLLILSVWMGGAPAIVEEYPPEETAPTAAPIVAPVASPTALPVAARPTPTPAGKAPTAPASGQRATPVPVPSPLPLEPGALNILLLGTDLRQSRDRSWRTDTMIVVAVRPQSGLVAMLSIPRDLWITVPGYGQNRINVVDYMGERARGKGGGPALVGATLLQNLGIPIHAYARVHFDGLVQIIDAVGGVTVAVERPFDEWIDDADGTPRWHLKLAPGTQRLDGRTALNYCRSRLGSSDLDRSRRQQQVLMALRDSALRPDVLPRLPSLVSALSGTVDTDVQPGQVLSLLQLAMQIKPEMYRRRVFDYTMARDWTTPTGAQVLLPNVARIAQVWAEMTRK